MREYRERKRISQDQLAALVGVSRQMVGLIEAGKRRIAAEDVAEWERQTGIPRAKLRSDLFGRGA